MDEQHPKVPIGDRRIDRGRVSVVMACAKGYVMVRRPHCVPYVVTAADWLTFQTEPRP